MNVTITKDTATRVAISGSITSANAHDLETAAAQVPEASEPVIIDARELEYISSAGLRVLLAIRKRCGANPFSIINVNDEVMNVFDVTGFSEIMDITRAKRQISVEGCARIGAGACGEVFRLDDETIIKLYYDRVKAEEIEREKALAKRAFVLGVPTAISYDIVEADGRTGVVYELIKSKTLSELIRENPENIETYTDLYADVCRQIHSIHADTSDLPDFKDLNRQDIPRLAIPDGDKQYLYRLLDIVPDSAGCIHGDLNINNIMVQNGECCLIDMGEFSRGIAMFDISRIVFSMEYASRGEGDYNAFYKLPAATVERVYRLFLKKYFGTESMEEAEKKNPEVRWLYPLAWFRCCTTMLKEKPWGEGKREMALDLLHNHLIPFVDSCTRG